MYDASIRKTPRGGENSAAEWNRPVPRDLNKGLNAGMALDRAGNALRQQQPPGNQVSVPGIHDDFNRLIQKISLSDVQLHRFPYDGVRRHLAERKFGGCQASGPHYMT